MTSTPTLLLPVTRDWSREAFVAALAASDIPRGKAVVVYDAPVDTDAWTAALTACGWQVEAHHTGNGEPPTDAPTRRERHLAMRRLTQTLVSGEVFSLEDDTLVPPDVFSRLSKVREGFWAATAFQVSRHGALRAPGVWRSNGATKATVWGHGVEAVDGCGHYCLLTSEYGNPIEPIRGEAIDYAHSRTFTSIGCDFDCVTGHLTPAGNAITRPLHLIEIRLSDYARVNEVPAIRHEGYWPAIPGFKGGIMDGTYTTKEPVVGLDGYVLMGKRREIPMQQAIEWAQLGLITDPELYDYIEPPFDPRTHVKPTKPKVTK